MDIDTGRGIVFCEEEVRLRLPLRTSDSQIAILQAAELDLGKRGPGNPSAQAPSDLGQTHTIEFAQWIELIHLSLRLCPVPLPPLPQRMALKEVEEK